MNIIDMSKSCVKCAKCVPSCTIYQIHRDETTSPRGFVDLLALCEKGDLKLDKNLKNIFETCFLCTTCTTQCPAKIDTATMIIKSRIKIAQKYGISWYKRAYFFLLRHRKIMDFVFAFTHFVAPCAFKSNGDRLRSRFPLSKFGARTIFPFAKKSFLNKYKNYQFVPKIAESSVDSATHTHKKVAIFIGCLSNYNYTEVGDSLIRILERLNIQAVIPKQECCAAPAYFTGDIKSVVHLVKKNIALFEGFWGEIDAMIIPEATCAAMIMVDWRHALEMSDLADKSAWIARLERLLPKIFMASDYLYRHTNLRELLVNSPKKRESITYHDPCHAKKVLGVYKEPRDLLGANYEIREMSECDRCCGFGGVTMQSQKYRFARDAGIAKARNIADSGAQIVSAECSACRMQLNNAMDAESVPTRFKHPIELIAEAL
ncbi:(Fe-S)-binding protein [Helicobacter sp. 23-1045]